MLITDENQAPPNVPTFIANEAGMAETARRQTEADAKRAVEDEQHKALLRDDAFTRLQAAMERRGLVLRDHWNDYVGRLRTLADGSTAMLVRYPSADPTDLKPVEKYHSILGAVLELADPNGAEALWRARQPKHVPSAETLRLEQLNCARDRWQRLPAAARACYRRAAQVQGAQRDALVLVAEALSDSGAYDPINASDAVLALLK